ncbi:hydantoinase/oxoprolinase family protein [Halobacterium wangiae]|uniref:hydantoinase/oxoprolinase family protein n=1 Tax=Halobacterium wangiae TaxID=2902623 RepID=UPI001E30723D|nr:hydantoinase/oxoprolinase family protein [Halobacterium wangiae]
MSTDDVRIGVDIGGTFTDIVTVRDGDVHVTKTPSTPGAPEEGVVNGLEKSRGEASFAFDDVGFLSHGTTVATNAVLEGTWADTALVTTEGFRDVLEIARQNRPDIYDFDAEKPAPIVPRDRRFEVPGRLDERGNVLRDLDEDRASDLADTIADSGVDSVAISLLFAFENDDHEVRVAELLREAGLNVSYSLSSDVLPEIREYERTLTTALNAALKPVMDSYIGNLESHVRDYDVGAELKIMQSNGGLITADAARGRPVNTLLSGPAGGVQGATYVAERCGVEDIITMDMGGTSCDVSLVQGGEPLVSTDVTVGDYAVGVPMIDIHTVGAGGGSIAWVDEGGALRVGPRSAGADPGPISYGRGGTEPTTTDAHLLLGRLDPDRFLSGELDVEVGDVRDAFDERLGDELGMDPQEAAQGVLDVANANMQRALRVVSVERGYDPRDFALVAFGGAGPLHACRLAADLDIPKVIVPQTAGVLSALGLLISDVLYDYSVSRVRQWSELSPATLTETFADLHEQGEQRLAEEDVAPADRRFDRTADLRYVGQSFEISVPVPDGEVDDATLDTVVERFHERHERRYGHADPDEPVELVTLRLRARGLVDTPELAPPTTEGSVADAIREVRTVTYDGEPHDTEIYDRETLPADATFDGPAVVEGKESTVVVHPGQTAEVDDYGNLVVETGGGR